VEEGELKPIKRCAICNRVLRQPTPAQKYCPGLCSSIADQLREIKYDLRRSYERSINRINVILGGKKS